MSSRYTDENQQDRPPAEIADWRLERFLLGELPPDEMESLRQRIEADDILQRRLETLRESDRELRDRYPADQMGRRIREQLEGETGEISDAASVGDTAAVTEPHQPSRSWLDRLGLSGWSLPELTPARVVPLAAALATILVLPFVFGPDRHAPDGPGVLVPTDDTRIKGDPSLLIFRKTDTGSEKLDDDATARQDDLILVQYIARGARHGAIVSIDGRGTLTQHLPSTGYQSVALEQDGPISLPYSYELDDAPHLERFYFITSDAPFEIDTIVRAAMTSRSPGGNSTGIAPTDSLSLPSTLKQFTFTLSKDRTEQGLNDE